MITDNDIKKLKQTFATKEDLKGFATKDDLIDFKDAILHEIQNLRDDVTVTTGYRDTLEDHEDRPEVIESHINTSFRT